MQNRSFTVDAASAGMTLAAFLERQLGLSGRKAKAIIDQRRVFVGRRRVWMARHPLHAGDRVEIAGGAPEASSVSPSARVLVELEDLLIVDKPAGCLANGPGSAEEHLRARFGEKGIVAVHRLDRDTSGCLLLARGEQAEALLLGLFKERRVEKHYEAIVRGRCPRRMDPIRLRLDGKPAVTHVELVEAGEKASHVRVRIETGRTHQIRKHLAAVRHPVIGDPVYGPPREQEPLLRTVSRQMLHAAMLRFEHPATGKMIQARAPLPPDFKSLLKQLGLR